MDTHRSNETPAMQGEVHRAVSRSTGTLVIVLDAQRATWLDPDGGRWITMCNEHNTLCNHTTRKLAMHHAPVVDWCEECMGRNDTHGETIGN